MGLAGLIVAEVVAPDFEQVDVRGKFWDEGFIIVAELRAVINGKLVDGPICSHVVLEFLVAEGVGTLVWT